MQPRPFVEPCIIVSFIQDRSRSATGYGVIGSGPQRDRSWRQHDDWALKGTRHDQAGRKYSPPQEDELFVVKTTKHSKIQETAEMFSSQATYHKLIKESEAAAQGGGSVAQKAVLKHRPPYGSMNSQEVVNMAAGSVCGDGLRTYLPSGRLLQCMAQVTSDAVNEPYDLAVALAVTKAIRYDHASGDHAHNNSGSPTMPGTRTTEEETFIRTRRPFWTAQLVHLPTSSTAVKRLLRATIGVTKSQRSDLAKRHAAQRTQQGLTDLAKRHADQRTQQGSNDLAKQHAAQHTLAKRHAKKRTQQGSTGLDKRHAKKRTQHAAQLTLAKRHAKKRTQQGPNDIAKLHTAQRTQQSSNGLAKQHAKRTQQGSTGLAKQHAAQRTQQGSIGFAKRHATQRTQ